MPSIRHLLAAFLTTIFLLNLTSATPTLRSSSRYLNPLDNSSGSASLDSKVGHEELLNLLTDCSDPSSEKCWSGILKVLGTDAKDDHNKNKDGKVDMQAVLQHIVTIASIVKTLKGL